MALTLVAENMYALCNCTWQGGEERRSPIKAVLRSPIRATTLGVTVLAVAVTVLLVYGVLPIAQAQTTSTCIGLTPTVVGTEGDDDIVGTSGADVIVGLGGADHIQGMAGDDRICGGTNPSGTHDKLFGGPGADRLSGDAGDDTLEGGRAPTDSASGSSDANDILRGGGGNDFLNGRDGDDKLYGGGGNDELRGDLDSARGPGNDYLKGEAGNDKLFDEDETTADADADTLLGDDGDDDLRSLDLDSADSMDGGTHLKGDTCRPDDPTSSGGFEDPAINCEKEPAAEGPVLVGAGDISKGSNSNDEATAKLIRSIPGTVFTLGDNVYDTGSLQEYNSYYEPTWGTEKARTKPSPGNHEYVYGTPKQYGAGYFDYFGAVAAEENAGSYSYDVGDWHVVSLNTGHCYGPVEADGTRPRCGPGDPMLAWLESDLEANQKGCTLAYFHHARWSSGSTHGSEPAYTKAIWDVLYAHDADVVLSGHNHNYERFAPQDPQGNRDDAGGIRQFVVGTGGGSLHGFGTTVANSEVRSSNTYGVLKIIAYTGGYDWEFVPVAGKTFTDSGSQSCH